MTINQQLSKKQKEWEEKLLDPYMKEHPDLKISKPFAFGVSEKYVSENAKTIMVVGQQTNGFRSYFDTDPSYRYNQEWSVEYFEMQLNQKDNRSPFWNLFRKIKENGMIPYWNNINNVEQYDNKSHHLNWEAEELFHTQIEGKSLLEWQIDIVKPDIILFAIGPDYKHSLSAALGIDEKELEECKPCYKIKDGKENKQYVKNITKLTNYDIPIYWTYHPAFLTRHKKIEELVDWVINVEV